MKDRPLVSVVIPTFNYGRYLAEAIESVFAQTYDNLELIVVDDGSTDDTAAVARAFGNRIHYLFQQNGGIGRARNAGLAVAAGDLLAFLDADDNWVPEKLSWQIQVLRDQPELDFVYGQARQYYSPEVSDEFKRRKGYKREIIPAPTSPAILIRRSSFYKVGLFRDIPVGVDQEWYMRSADVGLKSLGLPKIVFNRRIHENNTGVRASDQDKRERLRVIKEALDRRRTGSGGSATD